MGLGAGRGNGCRAVCPTRLQNPSSISQGAAEKLLAGSWFVTGAAFAELARGFPAAWGQREKPLCRKSMISHGSHCASRGVGTASTL